MSASVPKSIARRAITQAVQGLPAELVKHGPAIFDAIGAAFRGLGYELDLGPMTPDARADFGAVDKRIDARIAAQQDERSELDRRKTSDTDPAPPPTPSER